VQRYFGLCRRYEAAYRLQGVTTTNVNKVVRVYSSHRKVKDTTLQADLMQPLRPDQITTLQGLCHCHSCVPTLSKCAQRCCLLEKKSACTMMRCAQHGTVAGADISTLSSLAAIESKTELSEASDAEDKEEEEEESTLVTCRNKKCRRWRRVPLAWYAEFNKGSELFTCAQADVECESKCARCNNKACKCRCDECNVTIKSCRCKCLVCDERTTECSCGISDGEVDESDDDGVEASHEHEASHEDEARMQSGSHCLSLMNVPTIGLSLLR
jgi:hypothetical protein